MIIFLYFSPLLLAILSSDSGDKDRVATPCDSRKKGQQAVCLQGVRSLGRARQRTWDCLSRLPSVYFLFIFGVAFRHLSLFCRRKKKKRIHSHREDRKKTKRKTGIFCLGVLPAYPHLCNSFFLSFIAIFLQALPTSLLSHIPLFPTLLFLFIRHLNPHQQ